MSQRLAKSSTSPSSGASVLMQTFRSSLVPGTWTVQRGHQLLERLETDVRQALPNVTVFTHLEPLGDAASCQDMTLDRPDSIVNKPSSNPDTEAPKP